MECRECKVEVEKEDNFCWRCGAWTIKGYSFLKEPENIKIVNGEARRKFDQIGSLFVLACICGLVVVGIIMFRGQDLLRPYVYLKKEMFFSKYGYRSSVIQTNNQYSRTTINSLEEAHNFISKDLDSGKWQCDHDTETYILELKLREKYNISAINFCDISSLEVEKIGNVINEVFEVFPNASGYLTNITITNSDGIDDYVAYFQPINQFVNSGNSITEYNKVNKTQILLNSYYFLNKEVLDKPLSSIAGENWYPKGATWESIIAHELGHYIIFVALLKENNVNNITFITPDNYDEFNKILGLSNSSDLASRILNNALENYNNKYVTNYDIETFIESISRYAGTKNKEGNIIFEETIAEAVHDYYLNRNNASKSSLEIVKILKEKIM